MNKELMQRQDQPSESRDTHRKQQAPDLEPHLDSTEKLTEALKDSEPALRLYIYRQCRDMVQVDDILQKVHLYIWEKRDQWDPETPLLKWAYSIAYYVVKSHFRDQGREPVMLSAQALQLVSEGEEDGENELTKRRQRAMQLCLSQLKGKQQELINERYWQNDQVLDMAARRNDTANNIAQKLRRIRQKLHQCIETRMKTGQV